MGNEVVNYSAQINKAHEECLAAKELGGKKAHECGTWLTKQKESVPHGQWLPWVKANCKFSKSTAEDYMKIAQLDIPNVLGLSRRAAHEKASLAQREKERAEKRWEEAKSKPIPPETQAWIDELNARRAHSKEQAKVKEKYNQQQAKDMEALKEVAIEITKAGYRELSKKAHPDVGGSTEKMRKLSDAKDALLNLIFNSWTSENQAA